MRFCRVVGDIAVTAGCCVGVGFLSGKEAQNFFPDAKCVIVFAVCFALGNFALREFCRENRCDGVKSLCAGLGGKGNALNVALVMCSFVCLVTVLAGVDSCLSQLCGEHNLPVFGFAAAVMAAILTKCPLAALKGANALSLVLAAAMLAALSQKTCAPPLVPIASPAVYALFSVTMSLGLTAQLGSQCTTKQNLAVSVASAAAVALLMLAVLPLCDFGCDLPTLSDASGWVKILSAAAILLCSVTGLTANALPVVEFAEEFVQDKTLAIMTVFGLALTFGMFGFDFAVRWGYPLVALAGAAIVIAAAVRLVKPLWTKSPRKPD